MQLPIGVIDDAEEPAIFAGLPGHPMVWVGIVTQLLAFGSMLTALAVARVTSPLGFALGQSLLNHRLAGLGVAALVTSGWFASKASVAAEAGRVRELRGLLCCAIVLGGVFVGIKAAEYRSIGLEVLDSDACAFLTFYFVVLGMHGVQMLIGVVGLGAAAWHATPMAVRSGTVFWHVLHLLWITIYAAFYLVR